MPSCYSSYWPPCGDHHGLLALWSSQWTVHTGGHGSSTRLGIPINSLSCFLGAVAFGIAIDDGIISRGISGSFLKSRFPLKRPLKGGSSEMTDAFYKFAPCWNLSITALIASIPVVQIFAWLGMACFLAGLVVNLWIVPALLSEWWGR